MMYTPVKCCYSDEYSQDCETDAEWIVTDIDDPTTTLYACSGHLVEMMMNRNYVERFPQAAGRFRLESEVERLQRERHDEQVRRNKWERICEELGLVELEPAPDADTWESPGRGIVDYPEPNQTYGGDGG